MDEARTNSALKKLADSFLNDLRPVGSTQAHAGWGQFVSQKTGTQVGLYGTCAGVITIVLAYGDSRVPNQAVDYLVRLWEQRDSVATEGPRYFALTTRLAFFLLALRLAAVPAFTRILPEVDAALRGRLVQDGMMRSWEIDAARRAATGDEFSTAMGILAHSLTTPTKTEIAPEVQRAADALQKRLEGSASVNVGVRKFCLAAVTTALEDKAVTRTIRRMVRSNVSREHNRDQDSLYFWDYLYRGPEGDTSRRDYFHVPSIALDLLLAFGSVAAESQRVSARQLAETEIDAILTSGLYHAGRELATSNNQAWIALALSKAKSIGQRETRRGIGNWFGRYRWGSGP